MKFHAKINLHALVLKLDFFLAKCKWITQFCVVIEKVLVRTKSLHFEIFIVKKVDINITALNDRNYAPVIKYHIRYLFRSS